jgi:gentisate 1,2-dioxygenase
LPGAPADVEAMRYTNPTTGNVVISALDPALPHKWPEWNFMGAIWDFFERAPTR